MQLFLNVTVYCYQIYYKLTHNAEVFDGNLCAPIRLQIQSRKRIHSSIITHIVIHCLPTFSMNPTNSMSNVTPIAALPLTPHHHQPWISHICWLLPSNQSFYRQIARYRRPVGDHSIGQWWKGVMGQQTLIGVHSPCILCTSPQLKSCNYYIIYTAAYKIVYVY